jgi:molecular chaperone HtpG
MDNQFIPTIGKDVIESLTIGMYEDSRFIFREYIQNSADQIDKAVREGLIGVDQGEIHITIDPDQRRIVIEDNATGISQENVLPLLQNIAQSTKQRGVDKGFRGIGRLGGLAYCDKLIFETSFAGESVRSVVIWDAGLLRKIINNRKSKEEAVAVIQQVTTSQSHKEEAKEHYFKVTLCDVNSDELLDKREIEEYLSMVAPLSYATRFIFRSKIYEEANNNQAGLDEYKIYLNTEQLFKGYSTYIKKDETQAACDQVIDVAFFKSFARDGQLLFWGWHSLSEKNQSLNQVNYMRGFRLRKSNIQVGDEFTLLRLQRDRRFQFYFFGEIFGVHPDLIPNSRRDYFVENEIYAEFEQKLKTYFHTEIYRLCHTAADINTSIRKMEELNDFKSEYKQKSEQGFTDKNEHEEYRAKYERKIEEALKAKQKIEKLEADPAAPDTIKKILKRVVNKESKNGVDLIRIPEENKKPRFRTDNLSGLNKEERKFLSRIFSIIRNILDQPTAENVIQKIEEELK